MHKMGLASEWNWSHYLRKLVTVICWGIRFTFFSLPSIIIRDLPHKTSQTDTVPLSPLFTSSAYITGNKVRNLHTLQFYLCIQLHSKVFSYFPDISSKWCLWANLSPFRYTYSMLSVIGISYAVLTWLSQTLWMPIYPLCVLAEGKKRVTFLYCLLAKAILLWWFTKLFDD